MVFSSVVDENFSISGTMKALNRVVCCNQDSHQDSIEVSTSHKDDKISFVEPGFVEVLQAEPAFFMQCLTQLYY